MAENRGARLSARRRVRPGRRRWQRRSRRRTTRSGCRSTDGLHRGRPAERRAVAKPRVRAHRARAVLVRGLPRWARGACSLRHGRVHDGGLPRGVPASRHAYDDLVARRTTSTSSVVWTCRSSTTACASSRTSGGGNTRRTSSAHGRAARRGSCSRGRRTRGSAAREAVDLLEDKRLAGQHLGPELPAQIDGCAECLTRWPPGAPVDCGHIGCCDPTPAAGDPHFHATNARARQRRCPSTRSSSTSSSRRSPGRSALIRHEAVGRIPRLGAAGGGLGGPKRAPPDVSNDRLPTGRPGARPS